MDRPPLPPVIKKPPGLGRFFVRRRLFDSETLGKGTLKTGGDVLGERFGGIRLGDVRFGLEELGENVPGEKNRSSALFGRGETDELLVVERVGQKGFELGADVFGKNEDAVGRGGFDSKADALGVERGGIEFGHVRNG